MSLGFVGFSAASMLESDFDIDCEMMAVERMEFVKDVRLSSCPTVLRTLYTTKSWQLTLIPVPANYISAVARFGLWQH